MGQVVYPPGFVWNRQADWTERPAGDNGTFNGNPDDDQAGRRSWVYEYVAPQIDVGGIGSPLPWYLPHSFVTYPTCRWESDWFGPYTGWNRQHNAVPIVTANEHFAYQGIYHGNATWARWVNLSSCRMNVGITGTFHLRWGGATNTFAVDVVILVRRASGVHDLLLERSFPHPVGGNDLDFVLDLHGVSVGPGDSIVRTCRMHDREATRATSSSGPTP